MNPHHFGGAIARRLSIFFAALWLIAGASPALAMTVTAPSVGLLSKTAPFTIQWTTSNPATNVTIGLFQVTPTASIIASGWPAVANTGQVTLAPPASLVCDSAHSYKVGVLIWAQAASGHASGPTIEESAESKPFRLTCEGSGRTESLTVIKTVANDGPIPPPTTSFQIDVRCPPNGPNTTVTLNGGNGYQQVIPGVTVGANCTVTERPPVLPSEMARRGCRWETSYPGTEAGPGPRTALTTGTVNTTRRIINRWVCKEDSSTGTGADERQRSDLSIRKTGPTSVNVGETVAYTLTAFNNGTHPVGPPVGGVGVVVWDAIPAGFTIVSPQGTSSSLSLVNAGGGWTCFSPTLTCAYGGPPVPPNTAFPPLTVTVRAATAGTLQQCANVRWEGGGVDSIATNNKSCVGVVIHQTPR